MKKVQAPPDFLSDEEIVALYFARDESAIGRTDEKYGDYCQYIAYNILYDTEDARECVNDTWLDAWNCMPPHRPTVLSAFLGKLTRRISIDRSRKQHAAKRGGAELPLVLDELEDILADTDQVEARLEQKEMARLIGEFLGSLPPLERRIFLRRYWFIDSIAKIAFDYDCSESKITSMLHRTRKKLRLKLESENLA